MFKSHAQYLGRLFVLAGLSFLTTHAQQISPPRAANELLTSFAVPTNSAARAINDAPPVMRPAPALIIRNFIAAEKQFREAAIKFSFKRDVSLQTIGPNGEVTGDYIRNSIFVLDDGGQRIEQVLYHPEPSLKALKITKEDIQDLAGSQLFGLEAAEFTSYSFTYEREEDIDGRPAYVIRVNPQQRPDPNKMRERFFVGLIWIDQTNYQLLKLQGKTLPQGKQRFPAFQTKRDLQVESLRFPSSTSADEVLRFAHKDVHYRINVRYYDFKRFASRLTITEMNR